MSDLQTNVERRLRKRDGEYGPLLPHHAQLLRDSAIAPAVARRRGYFSATDAGDVADIGLRPLVPDWIDDWDDMISIPQSLRWGGRSATPVPLHPALAFPIWCVDGEIAFWMVRPDIPRRDRSLKVVKYERPAGSQNVLDVHPYSRERVLDPNETLYVTEGTRKVDSAVSAGLCCVGVLGVWSWSRGKEDGKSVPLDDFDLIPLDRRTVVIAFDSDVTTKSGPRRACGALRDFLTSRGAEVKVLALPPGPAGEKVGLDDFLACNGIVEDLGELVLPQRKTRKRRNRFSGGSGSQIREQVQAAGRLLRERVPEGSVRRMLVAGFGISDRTARLRVKAALGQLDEARHPRVAKAARSAALQLRVTDERKSSVGEESENRVAGGEDCGGSSRSDVGAAARRDGYLGGEERRNERPDSFFFPLGEVDLASVTLTRACDACGTTFPPKRSDGRYCSSRCRQRAYRARKARGQ
jgi:hypothetical protein